MDKIRFVVDRFFNHQFLEFLNVIGPLTIPLSYGGRAQDVFNIVIPAFPGYGFSGMPKDPGWGPDCIAHAWEVLRKRPGYAHYVPQGGDHGSVISDAPARQTPAGLTGIHLTMPVTIRKTVRFYGADIPKMLPFY